MKYTINQLVQKTILVLLLISFFVESKAQKNSDNTTIEINLSKLNYKADKIYFTYYNTETKERFTDSAEINKNVSFQTNLSEPALAELYIFIRDKTDTSNKIIDRDHLSLFIEVGKIQVSASDSLKNSIVKGSQSHIDYTKLEQLIKPYNQQISALFDKNDVYEKENNDSAIDKNYQLIDSLHELINEKVYKPFIEGEGNQSAVALYALTRYSGYSLNPEKVEPLYLSIHEKVRNLPTGKQFSNKIQTAKSLSIGQYAINFTQNDTAGIPVSLSSFKGQYVLLDFWASWCGPCRVDNPNVVKAYQKFKDKGFTVLGISLDRLDQKDKWMEAIAADQLTWTHVSDLKFWKNAVAELYDIKAIPQNFLIDREGKIIAKNIHGEDIEKELSKIFDNP